MIKSNIKIVHLADIHIVNEPKQHYKFREQFDKLYKMLNDIKPDKIVLVGDTLDAFITTTLESETLAAELLNNLSKYGEVIVVIGNHEIRKRDLNRESSIGAIVKMIDNDNVKIFDKSGFIEDGDIIWVNYSHLQKNILPWKDITHVKNDDKVYISLFHDPIYGCKLPNGTKMDKTSLVNLKDFGKNDLNLLGDIHLRQFLNDTTAYPGSLLQNTFGENVENHGFLLWEIDKNKNITHKEYNIPNEYTLITFELKENCDYDKIDFDHKLATEKSTFRVKWTDLAQNINIDNEEKIKKYIRDKWGSENPIKFKKIKIFQNIASAKKISESLNMNDKVVQQEIFREYLENNGYDEKYIKEIIAIDNIVSDRLESNNDKNNIEWNIDRFWIENFKSYEKLDLEWNDIHGLIKIGGENQQGKTTILDAICYILFGTTLATSTIGGAKREKHGDNRYINNKRDLDFCSGGAVLNINGEKFTIERKTSRSWKKDGKTISSCSTVVDYWKGIDTTIDENKDIDEGKAKTQKLIQETLGDFDDFIRLSLTNADNLNSLISLDRATFIDSVIRDAGYDVFEKKLDEFKSYKKEVEVDKININLDEVNDRILTNKTELELLETYKENDEKSITDLNKIIDKHQKTKDDLNKKLHNVDKEISGINIEEVNNKIIQYKNKTEEYINTQKSNNDKSSKLKTEYDKTELDALYKESKSIDDGILNSKLKISQTETSIETEKSTCMKVDDKIEDLVEKEIDRKRQEIKDFETEITNLKNDFNILVKDEIRNISDVVTEKVNRISNIDIEIKNLNEKIEDKNKTIIELENSKVCSECDRPHVEDTLKHLSKKIKGIKDEITEMDNKIEPLSKEKEVLTKDIENLNEEIDKIKNGGFNDELTKKRDESKVEMIAVKNKISDVETIITELQSGDYTNATELEEKIKKGLVLKRTSIGKIKSYKDDIEGILASIDKSKLEAKTIEKKVILLERIKEEVDTYNVLIQENKELSLKIDNIRLTVENAKTKIDRYYEQLKYINENKTINEEIISVDVEIELVKDEIKEFDKTLKNALGDIATLETKISDDEKTIKKFKKQAEREALLKMYMSCVHRDGIPTMLIMKSKELINKEISDLLCECDFDVFFNDDLALKLVSHISPDVEQNLLESSGKERTFGAIALKLALREINHKSKTNLLFLDEIYGKLLGNSVEDFNNLLVSAKNKIDKILIIEHHANIPYDSLFNVIKDEKGISNLEITI